MYIFDENFLLDTDEAARLYHDYMALLPIIDYHTHLDPRAIAENHSFLNITEAWLAHDHYKWRAMRTAGVDESLITGDAPDIEKFHAWAATVHRALRNPLYHWTHLELSRIFGINEYLTPHNADEIYHGVNELLRTPDFTVRGITEKMMVRYIGTTDDPAGDLPWHESIASGECSAIVAPTFRPDRFIEITDSRWLSAVEELEGIVTREITSFDEMRRALDMRMDYFDSHGCGMADISLSTLPAPLRYPDSRLDEIFQNARKGRPLGSEENDAFRFALVVWLGQRFASRNWVMQLHLLAERNNNSAMFALLGRDAGFDSIGEGAVALPLNRLLDAMGEELPKTIIYTLNPSYNEVIASTIGNFQRGPEAGKIQFGAGWWFNDQLDGMTRHLEALSSMGLVSTFVGMLTDSRSFLSFTRHEYFRRLLASLFGRDMARGLIPRDFEYVGGILRDIGYHNAQRYFGVEDA